MPEKFCIRLPFLLGGLKPEQGRFPLARRLWPGLPMENISEMRGLWQPDDYPFQPREAQELASRLRELTSYDLDAMRLAAPAMNIAGEMGLRDEMAALSQFRGQPETSRKGAFELAREQAQKTLLWHLLQEEMLEGIAALAARCQDAENAISDCFQEQPQPGNNAPASSESSPDMSLMPSWKACVASAAFFLPAHIPVLAEGEMRAELLENPGLAKWQPGKGLADLLGCDSGTAEKLRVCRAPLWQVLGHSRQHPGRGNPGNDAALASIYGVERDWILWSEA